MIPDTLNVRKALFAPGQHVIVLDNGDPDDPYTGATGRICQRMAGPKPVYGVLFDEVVNGRWMANFRADELDAVAE